MARISKFLDSVEDLWCFNISSLTKRGLLIDNSFANEVSVILKKNGISEVGFSLSVNILSGFGNIDFSYSYYGTIKKYTVEVVSRPSNLGKGVIWFFICPVTKKVCRKLYFHKGLFLHRTAFPEIIYEQQKLSKRYRKLDKTMKMALDESIYQEFYQKHLKTHYRGKPTRRFERITKKLAEKDSFSYDDILMNVNSFLAK